MKEQLMKIPSCQNHIGESIHVFQSLYGQVAIIDQITKVVSIALYEGHTLFACGNGGSATDAIHLVQELVGRYRNHRRALPAICLNSDVGSLTCIANDFGYDQVFARQLEALGRPGDVLVCFSTSGTSPNILAVLQKAREHGMVSIALLGKDGGPAQDLADYAMIVASYSTARIQEIHTFVLHAMCEACEALYELYE